MLLSDNKIDFKNIVERVSKELKIASSFIEKDYYAISILKELIKRNDKFVFKGGTSLSVCQRIIQRFSEDIDISYEDEIITVSNRRKIEQTFFDSIEAVSLKVSNPDNIRSRRLFNRYLCPYETVTNHQSIDFNTVIVEWATLTPSFPIEEKTAQTIIGKYFDQIGRHDLTIKYGLEEFTVKTITKERTLVDKIFAICDYHINKKIIRQSRHIYDIYHLLKHVELNDDFIELFLKVKEYRSQLESCVSVNDGMVISTLLNEIVEQNTYVSDYNNRTYPLLYDHVKYQDCLPSLKAISKFLTDKNL